MKCNAVAANAEAGDAAVAAIDIGTNSVLLLIASSSRERGAHGSSEAGGVRPVLERATVTRLGQGVDRTKRLAPDAIERTRACLASYAEDLRRLGVTQCAVVGTSALRDAEGSEVFRGEIETILGVPLRVLSGTEEARLTYRGATSGLSLASDPIVFDIGGGSTEIVTSQAEGSEPYRVSFDVGSVRLHERHLHTDPPASSELRALQTDAATLLNPLRTANLGGDTKVLVGVAGTVTTLAALHGAIAPYDGARVHGQTLTKLDVEDLVHELERMPTSERATLPGLDPKRADVIVAGAYVALAVLDALGAESFVVSDRGVRWGLVLDLIEPDKGRSKV